MDKINGSTKLTTNYLAVVLLAIMFLLMLGSMRGDSAIIDELAHIPAGFGYLQGDYRLNPEHPPLIKTLAAVSGWLFARPHTTTGGNCAGIGGYLQCLFGVGASPNFPTDTKTWQKDVNGQWEQGAIFLYESGNDADRLIFWMRLPIVFLALFFGWLIFRWVQKRFGSRAALLSLTFYAFSPTFLTHSRFVTTDLGAAFGFFIGIVSFVWFLERPTWKNAVLTGLVFAAAQLLKFSLVLLIPIYVILFLAWIATRPHFHLHERFRAGGELLLKILTLGLVGFFLVWMAYIPLVFNYPQERQTRDTKFLLSSYGTRPVADAVVGLTKNPLTRPLAQYLLGVLMVNQRASGGNTQYFMGEVSAGGFASYFPALYLLKEPLAFHILTLIAVWFAAIKTLRSRLSLFPPRLSLERLRDWVADHFTEFASLVFITFYWGISIQSPLNIGIRHVLPTFPFIYLLVALQLNDWLVSHDTVNPSTWLGWLRNIYEIYLRSIPRYLAVAGLLFWLAASAIASYPNFMTYYNELAGGERNGFNIAVDSNYDWGQDLKRLAEYAEKNSIEKIAVDYFGGGSVKYYFGNKGENWWSARGYPSELTGGPSLRSGQTPDGVWFAVSATHRQNAFGKPVAGFIRRPEDSYLWLRPYEPVARIGSMFVYKLPTP